MKERKKGEHAMVRKLFMLMAAFVLVLCMKTTTYAASTNRQYGKCRLRYVYPYRHYETWKRNCLPQGKSKEKRHPDRCRGSNRRRRNAVWYGSSPV